MIFYIALDENGHRQLRGTQADARSVNRDFTQIDIPTDKAGLMAFIQNLYQEADEQGQLALDGYNMGVADRMETETPGAEPEPSPPTGGGGASYEAQPPAPRVRTTDEIEEQWPNLPLQFRFHLCAMTMEDARNIDWNGTAPAKAKQGYGGKG